MLVDEVALDSPLAVLGEIEPYLRIIDVSSTKAAHGAFDALLERNEPLSRRMRMKTCLRIFSTDGDPTWDQNRPHRKREISDSPPGFDRSRPEIIFRQTYTNVSQLSRETGKQPETRNAESNTCILAPAFLP